MSRPTSGDAWSSLQSYARSSWPAPDVSDQDSHSDSYALAGALVAVRTDDDAMRARTIAYLEDAIGSEDGGRARWLAIGRNLGGFIIAADVLGIRSGPAYGWLAGFKTRTLSHNNHDGQVTLRQSAWASGSNASAQEGFVHAALAVYTGDEEELDWAWDAFRRFAGDRTSPHTLTSNDDSWQQIPSDPVGVQNAGATKNGHRLDGAIGNDMSRGDSFRWPPGYTQYPWVGMEGFVPAALVLHRAGYPALEVADQAVKRAGDYLWSLRQNTDDERWWNTERAAEIKHLLAYFYRNEDRPYRSPVGGGRTTAFTDWTHPLEE